MLFNGAFICWWWDDAVRNGASFKKKKKKKLLYELLSIYILECHMLRLCCVNYLLASSSCAGNKTKKKRNKWDVACISFRSTTVGPRLLGTVNTTTTTLLYIRGDVCVRGRGETHHRPIIWRVMGRTTLPAGHSPFFLSLSYIISTLLLNEHRQ